MRSIRYKGVPGEIICPGRLISWTLNGNTSYLLNIKGKNGLDNIKHFTENRRLVLGLVLVLMFAGTAILAPWISPRDPLTQNLKKRLVAPCREYPFGADELGRCVLSRTIHGTRTSLMVSLVVVAVTTIIGTLIGLVSGTSGGLADEIIMRLVDVFLAFPGIILALVISGVLGPGLFNAMLALAVTGWTGYARVVRGCVLSTREKTFVRAARAIGGGRFYTMFRHILPEVAAPVLVMASLGMGWLILSGAALSFLGLGAQPPLPEWGSMLNSGRAYIKTAWHLCAFPGLAIMLAVLGFNFLGDGLRDLMDPRALEREGF